MKYEDLERYQGARGVPDERQWKIIEKALSLTRRRHPTMDKNLCDDCFSSEHERDIEREYRTWIQIGFDCETVMVRVVYGYHYDGLLEHHPSWTLSIEEAGYGGKSGIVLFAASISLSIPHAELTAGAKTDRWQFLVDVPGEWESLLHDHRD